MRLRWRMRKLTARHWRIAMPERIERLNRYIGGWCSYFGLAETSGTFKDLDGWLRRRLRQVRWAEWKHAPARRRNLIRLGITPREARSLAGTTRGSWPISASYPLQAALPNRYWTELGLHGFGVRWQLRHA
ncbi:MAG TPA: group II intron maturase-specific domain-containing protein [Gemmatimonadales bacterium]|nr:group II intron maturase-specific domain-containing protein [Gemmatimonadales bacterium]